jgi:putative cell wall-binding protein/Tol biopolymer transport system component
VAAVLILVVPLPAADAFSELDRTTQSTQLVSSSPTGEAGDAKAFHSAVSAEGRYVAFASEATNLTSMPVPSSESQVYVRDVVTGSVVLASMNSARTGGANDSSYDPSISADGRYVAFTSFATDLPAGVPLDGHTQVYLHDMMTGSTQLVSRNAPGTAAGNYNSFAARLSGDGSHMAFSSVSTNILPGTSVDVVQVLGAEVQSGAMAVVRVLSTRDSALASPGQIGNADSRDPTLSYDGKVVAFSSSSTNLTGDAVSGAYSQIFLHSVDSGRTWLVSVASDGVSGGNANSRRPALSSDGRRIAYDSKARNLSPASASTIDEQVYVRDMSSLASQLVSVNVGGDGAANGLSLEAAISGDGNKVAFRSQATDVVRADVRGSSQVYWRDIRMGVTALASASSSDALRGSGPSGAGSPSISADGQAIAFSAARDLLEGTSAEPAQIYLRQLEGPRVERIGGADRFAVSAAVSAATFPAGVPVAYIASGAVFSDALSGSAAAGVQGGPVLLVGKDSLPDAIAAELARLKPARIVVLGGLATIGAGVESALAAFGAPVSRIAGADRFAVSASVSEHVFAPGIQIAFVASGAVFPDALSGSAAAGLLGGPVLLIQKDAVPAQVAAELDRLQPKNIVVLGGANTISAAAVAQLGSHASVVRRIDGADRFEVSANVVQDAFTQPDVVYVASGAVFPDALSGSATAIADRSPVLLVTKDAVPSAVATQLERLDPYRIVLLGGPNTISDTVKDALEKYLRR